MSRTPERRSGQPGERARLLWNNAYQTYLRLGHTLEGLAVELGLQEEDQEGALDLAALSQREMDVLILLRQAEPVRKIADSLHISVHTARNHTKTIYRKLGVHSRVELIRRLS